MEARHKEPKCVSAEILRGVSVVQPYGARGAVPLNLHGLAARAVRQFREVNLPERQFGADV